MSAAVSTSSEAARIMRPVRDRERKACMPPMTAIAVPSPKIPTRGRSIPAPKFTEAVAKRPTSSERTSAENPSISAFWMTIDNPKVATSVAIGPALRLGVMSRRCMTYPRRPKAGAITTRPQAGSRVCVSAIIAMKAARTARSPCARLTMRMTPNMIESPDAKRAKTPPRRMPCKSALRRSMN